MFGTSTFSNAKLGRRLLGLAVGLFGLSAAVACTGLEGLDAEAAQAIIQNVDSLSGEVTVEFKDGTTTTFNLADVDVEALGQLIGSASLQTGDEIEVELNPSNKVTRLTPHAANFHGVITAVDTDATTVSIEAENGVEITLTLTARTKIELEGNDNNSVDDLQPGLPVKVKYNPDTDEALKIKREDAGSDDEGEAKGVITAINDADHTITVEDRHGIEEIYTAHSDTEIEFHGPAHFGDLDVGMPVKIEFDPASLALEEVKVDDDDDHGRGHDDDNEEAEVKGVITAINDADHTITVEGENGIEETYTAHSDTEFEVHGAAEFGDLEVDMHVEIEFDPETLVLSEVEVTSDNSGHDNARDALDDVAHDEGDDHQDGDDEEREDEEDEDDE